MAPPLYVTLADELSALVENGQLKSGDRLPSVRTLVRQKGISATTAMAALRAVEHRGFAEARPQSGYFARPSRVAIAEPVSTRSLAVAHDVGIDDVMVQVIEASHDPAFAPLGAAAPDAELFPLLRLRRILASTARRRPELLGEYSLSFAGVDTLRHQLLRRYADIGCAMSPDEIVITNGCTEALNLALRTVTRPGDTVAVESPAYYCILQVLQGLGLKALEIACHPSEGMRIDALAEALRERGGRTVKACLVSANFSNLGARPLPAKAFDRDGGVILCSSFSKTLAPGARIGWLCGGRFTPALKRAKWASSGSSPAILQEVIAQTLASGGYERHLVQLRATYAQRVAQVAAAVLRHFPAGTRMTQPRGGFVLWIELPRGTDSLQLFDAALRQGVNFAPGPLFSATGRYRHFLRLNCGRRWTPALDAAVARLGRLAAKMGRV
jgi:DNA-binding transcriptional MocR family regulator